MDPISSIRSFSSALLGCSADHGPAPSRAGGRAAHLASWTPPAPAPLDTDTLLEVLVRVLAEEQEGATRSPPG